jgi:hypothetical protein
LLLNFKKAIDRPAPRRIAKSSSLASGHSAASFLQSQFLRRQPAGVSHALKTLPELLIIVD